MLDVRYKQDILICGARRWLVVDERGRVTIFHVVTLDVLVEHVKQMGWFTIPRLILVPPGAPADIPPMLAAIRRDGWPSRSQRLDPALFTGEWDIEFYGDPEEFPPHWIDIAVAFRRGGRVMFTVETCENIAASLADPTMNLDEHYHVDLLAVERIDRNLISDAVASVISMGLLRCGIWTLSREDF